MDFEKIKQELETLSSDVTKQLNKLKADESLKYLDIFKKYDKTLDFSLYPIEVIINTIYYNGVPNHIEIKAIHDSAIHKWRSDTRLITIKPTKNISKDKATITGVECSSSDFDLTTDSSATIDWNLYKMETSHKMVKAITKHGDDIINEMLEAKENGEVEVLENKLNAIHHFTNSINRFKSEFVQDYIYRNNGINLEVFKSKGETQSPCLYAAGLDGNTKTIDELFFTQNPSGTYTVHLKYRGNVISQSNRASLTNIEYIIKGVADGIIGQFTNFETLLK